MRTQKLFKWLMASLNPYPRQAINYTENMQYQMDDIGLKWTLIIHSTGISNEIAWQY